MGTGLAQSAADAAGPLINRSLRTALNHGHCCGGFGNGTCAATSTTPAAERLRLAARARSIVIPRPPPYRLVVWQPVVGTNGNTRAPGRQGACGWFEEASRRL